MALQTVSNIMKLAVTARSDTRSAKSGLQVFLWQHKVSISCSSFGFQQ